jgi:tetratricopeptide (TPR) repeat protein
MTELAAELIYTNPNESEALAKQAIDISKKLKYYQGTSKAYYVLCVSYDIRGDYVQAAENAQYGISLIQSYEYLDVKKEIYGSLLNGLGLAYYHQSRYNDALTSFFSALKIFSDSNNIPRLANLNNNIGLVYHDLQDLDKALVLQQHRADLHSKKGIFFCP